MNKRIYILLTVLFVPINWIHAQEITATEVIEKSIEYHDPQHQLVSKTTSMDFIETRPSKKDRLTRIRLSQPKELFEMVRQGPPKIQMLKRKDSLSFLLDGQSTISKQDREAHQLNADRLRVMHHYYRYLWLLPHPLTDPGTLVEEQVQRVIFDNQTALQIKITYDPLVGSDIWYFYFEPSSYALIGYRFYHDEDNNDGEYIVLSDEMQLGTIKIPKTRKWFTHQGDKFLGEDILEKLSIE